MSQNLDVEVDEKAQPEVLKSQISQKLRPVYGDDPLYGFHFDDERPFDKQIKLNMTV